MAKKNEQLDEWHLSKLANLILQECSERDYWKDRAERSALPPSMSELMF